MKSPIIILIVLILSTTSAYSAMDCKDVKKTSPKYLLCKAGSSVSSFKNKMSKKRRRKLKMNLVKNHFLKNLEKQNR